MKVLLPAYSKLVAHFVKGQSLKEMAEKTKYFYAKENLIFSVPRNGGKPTPFDQKLEGEWAECIKQELFRYQLTGPDCLPTRITSGPLRLSLLFNSNRSTDRRKPEAMMTMAKPFNEDGFNFTKIRPQEIVAEMIFDEGKLEESANRDCENEIDGRNLLVINVSPLEYCHYLFVPDVFSKWTQLLHRPSHLHLALHTVLLSSSPFLRFCFNSLCGCASVNHLHFHIYLHYRRLSLETVELDPITHSSAIHTLDCPGIKTTCRGLAFQILSLEDIDAVCQTIVKLTNWLTAKDTAYNLYATRGSPFNAKRDIPSIIEPSTYPLSSAPSSPSSSPSISPSSVPEHYSALRVFLWPRKKFVGSKSIGLNSEDYFHVAACELAGHLVLSNKTAFDQLTEESAMKVFSEPSLDDESWNDFVAYACSI